MEIRNLYEAATLDAVLARIDALTPESTPSWGRMSVAQMLAHAAEVQEVLNGKPLKGTPWFIKLLGGIIKKGVLSPKPYAHGLRTHPQYVMSEPKEFEQQRERLRAALHAMYKEGPERAGDAVHPLFGPLTASEKGWAAYKHVDHHLTQFSV